MTLVIVLKPFVNKISKLKGDKTKWRTMGGSFETKRKAKIKFKMPEFSHNKVVQWVVHVNKMTSPDMAQYDMVIGTDLMTELKL